VMTPATSVFRLVDILNTSKLRSRVTGHGSRVTGHVLHLFPHVSIGVVPCSDMGGGGGEEQVLSNGIHTAYRRISERRNTTRIDAVSCKLNVIYHTDWRAGLASRRAWDRILVEPAFTASSSTR
jgi:hypothetical protein